MSAEQAAAEPGPTIRKWDLPRMPFVQGFAVREIAAALGGRLLEAGEASGDLPVQPGSEAHMVHWLKLAFAGDRIVEALYGDDRGTDVAWCIAYREHFGERDGIWQETPTNRDRRAAAAAPPASSGTGSPC